MLQITPQMRVLVAIEPVDGRKGIDSLAQLCRERLAEDPFSGCMFVFRTRSRTSIRILIFDGQGYWIATKRLSAGRYRFWPSGAGTRLLEAHQVQTLFAGGDPSVRGAPTWRPVTPLRPWSAAEKSSISSGRSA